MIINLKYIAFRRKIIEILFIFLCSLSGLVYARHADVISNSANEIFYTYCINLFRTIFCIILLNVFNKFISNKREGYNCNRCGIPFLLTYSAASIIVILLINKITLTNFSGIIIQVSLSFIMLFSSYICKIKISKYFHKIKFRELFVILCMFSAYCIPILLLHGKFGLRYYIFGYSNILGYLVQSIYLFIFTAFYEEVLFRGLLISKLKNYGLSEQGINIIQSIVFGIGHCIAYMQFASLQEIC